jgi:hypothetical protein
MDYSIEQIILEHCQDYSLNQNVPCLRWLLLLSMWSMSFDPGCSFWMPSSRNLSLSLHSRCSAVGVGVMAFPFLSPHHHRAEK